jgi:hypothetical protein
MCISFKVDAPIHVPSTQPLTVFVKRARVFPILRRRISALDLPGRPVQEYCFCAIFSISRTSVFAVLSLAAFPFPAFYYVVSYPLTPVSDLLCLAAGGNNTYL